MSAVLTQVEWRNRGSEDSYEGWRIILYGWRGGTTEYMKRRHSSRNEAGLPEMNFEGWFIKTKHSYLPIMEHLSKCGLQLSIIFSHSFGMMYISLYKFSRSLIQQCNISQFLIYYLLVKMNFFFYIVKDLVNLGLLVAKLYFLINWIMISVVYF